MNNNAYVHSAVVVAGPLWKFTRFMQWMQTEYQAAANPQTKPTAKTVVEDEEIRITSHIHRVPQKTCDYIFYNNFNNRCPITVIFGIVSSKSMRYRMMVSFPTSPI